MAFLLIRSGKQMVRLSSSSSSWAATPAPAPLLRALTSVKNCFSTDSSSSSSGGMMIQESNPKKDAAFKAGMRKPTPIEYFGLKWMNDILNDKPLPSPEDPDFDKFVDDLTVKLITAIDETQDSTLKTVCADDVITSGVLENISKPPAFKLRGDNFNFTLDTNGLYLTVNVSGLPKEALDVWVDTDRQLALISSKDKVAPDQKVRVGITMPDEHDYDPGEVTGTIMEDGLLKISFPVSKEGGQKKKKYFEVNLV